MPPLEETEYNETAVLWSYAGKDRFGKPNVHAPVAIMVRWEQTEIPLIGQQQRPLQYDARIYTDEVIPNNSILWLGELADFHGTRLSDLDDRIMIVDRRQFMKDLKGRITQQFYNCRRYMDAIPPIV